MTTTTPASADPNNPHRKAPATVDMWSGEFGDTLTGDEEVDLGKAFGTNLDGLSTRGVIDIVRGLIFVHRMREGDDAKTAKKHALALTRREAADYFTGLGVPTLEGAEAEGKD